jgi:hypothetical protein
MHQLQLWWCSLLGVGAGASSILPGQSVWSGGCCEPESTLQWFNSETGKYESRAGWITKECKCLPHNQKLSTNLGKGQYHHYHFKIPDVANTISNSTPRVVFWLIPCDGVAYMFVKPALLGDGLKMNQMFETVSDGKFEGNHTKTWPFPDKTTGVLPQGVSGTFGNLTHNITKRIWGRSSTRDALENAITFKIQHESYFVSVYAESDTHYTLMAKTFTGKRNPVQVNHLGAHRQRRLSIEHEWKLGQLQITWNTSGAELADKYQLYMTAMPVGNDIREKGTCGQALQNMGTLDNVPEAEKFKPINDHGYKRLVPPIQHASSCIVWTVCGVERNMVKVGKERTGSDVTTIYGLYNDENEDLWTKEPRMKVDVGIGTWKARMTEFKLAELECQNADGSSICNMLPETPYYFTIVRTPADPAEEPEVYYGMETSWSTKRVHDVTYSMLVEGSVMLYWGLRLGIAMLFGMILIILLCVRSHKNNVSLKLVAVFREVQGDETSWTAKN